MTAPASPPAPAPRRAVVITCEHAGYEIPPELRQRITIAPTVLTSHRGYDAGGREIALALAERLGTTPLLASVTRLVVDLNRSESSGGIFSPYGRGLSEHEREQILRQHYRPFRASVHAKIAEEILAGCNVLHVSVHTFTPVLRGNRRTADVGLLYDPQRSAESHLAAGWIRSLQSLAPRLVVKMNYPYLGIDDGHTTKLRTIFPDPQYAGIELEVNQKWVRGSGPRFTSLLSNLAQSLADMQ